MALPITGIIELSWENLLVPQLGGHPCSSHGRSGRHHYFEPSLSVRPHDRLDISTAADRDMDRDRAYHDKNPEINFFLWGKLVCGSVTGNAISGLLIAAAPKKKKKPLGRPSG